MGLAAGMLAGAMTRAEGQSTSVTIKRKQENHARRETNASRQARIQRTIDETYSHRYEIFGGGGYLRWTSGANTKRNNEVSWDTQLNYYFNQRLSAIGNVQGSIGNAHTFPINNTYGVYNPQINEYFFQGGAGYRFYRTEKISVTAQALGGTAWGIFSGGAKGLQGTQLGLWPDGFKPAFSIGIEGDYNVFPNLAFRITPTYQATTFGSSVQNNVGFNAGVVYRFGKQ
jgi:hypothetical protein